MAAVTIILGLGFTVAELRDSNTPGRTPDGVLPGPVLPPLFRMVFVHFLNADSWLPMFLCISE